MQRPNARRAPASAQEADALPEQALTTDWYARAYQRWWDDFLGHEWPEGSPEIVVAVEQATADLVDKHGIVPSERRDNWHAHPGLRGLRAWLEFVVVGYFGLKDMIDGEITDQQALAYKRRIARLGEALRKELESLYGVGSAMRGDIAALEQIIARAQRHEVLGDRPTKTCNASKDALHVLSAHICLFWLPYDHWQRGRACEPLDFSVRSPCFRSAKYMYAYLGAPRCTDRMIVKRLRAAELQIITGRQDERRRFYCFPAIG